MFSNKFIKMIPRFWNSSRSIFYKKKNNLRKDFKLILIDLCNSWKKIQNLIRIWVKKKGKILTY